MSETRNRPDSKTMTDRWLTPPEVIGVAGSFDMDPACEPIMPWRTAKVMVSNERPPDDDVIGIKADVFASGLEVEWNGRLWVNCPWSEPFAWACKMATHANGLWLSSGKSSDTEWAQIILSTCDAVLFPAGRPLFHYVDGSRSTGKWTPVMLAAYGLENVEALRRVKDKVWPGVILSRGIVI